MCKHDLDCVVGRDEAEKKSVEHELSLPTLHCCVIHAGLFIDLDGFWNDRVGSNRAAKEPY